MTAKKSILEKIEAAGNGRYTVHVRIMGIAYCFSYENKASAADIALELAHDGYDVTAYNAERKAA
jgi:hypothetical protein